MFKSQTISLLLAAALLFGSTSMCASTLRPAKEAGILVAYLYNFGKFIEWPEEAFASPHEPIRFCFYGDDSLGPVIDSLENKRINKHPIELSRNKRGGSITRCHLLFIESSELPYIGPLLELTASLPVLTISDVDGFAATGGIIELVTTEKKLRFKINKAAADEAGFFFSSQLLMLAIDIIE